MVRITNCEYFLYHVMPGFAKSEHNYIPFIVNSMFKSIRQCEMAGVQFEPKSILLEVISWI